MRMTKFLAAAAIVAVAAAGLAGCASGSSDTPATPIGTNVIAPVTMEANDLQGATVDLVVGQVLNINTGDLAVDSYTGEVADASVATFVAGHKDDDVEFNPGVQALAAGKTDVTMTNSNGGIQPLSFTVVVSAK
ncbi:MAG: hypothetical protein EPO52_03830 [Herbiconiux sp.]|uniref:hypothetical protein n=1 Tax=Herbiconiux sp. TaxID=1871186 RepID=UPI0011F99704|nr:hypothetical protein [Herbiconiux sp.]TAJ49412.1 MAG: hypothetical protein EPO52_03830 [Herbiconiux sp.]